MSSKLKYAVGIYNNDGEQTSECRYPTLLQGNRKFDKAVVSAACANVGRITLIEYTANWCWSQRREWLVKPDLQVAGFVVHSLRTLRDNTGCQPVNKEFHETATEAVNQAINLANKWRDDHEGLIVFKAIKHVHRGNGIVIEEIS